MTDPKDLRCKMTLTIDGKVIECSARLSSRERELLRALLYRQVDELLRQLPE